MTESALTDCEIGTTHS